MSLWCTFLSPTFMSKYLSFKDGWNQQPCQYPCYFLFYFICEGGGGSKEKDWSRTSSSNNLQVSQKYFPIHTPQLMHTCRTCKSSNQHNEQLEFDTTNYFQEININVNFLLFFFLEIKKSFESSRLLCPSFLTMMITQIKLNNYRIFDWQATSTRIRCINSVILHLSTLCSPLVQCHILNISPENI